MIRLAMIGDATAFTALWDKYIDSLRAYLKSWISNLDAFYIDDICSRSFEKAFRQISTYDPGKSLFLTWLKIIARNTALDVMGQEKSRKFLSLDDDARQISVFDSISDDVETPLESIIRTEDRERTKQYIEGLPELYREIARKRLVDGLQYKEISEETGVELNTVRTRIRRARTMIEEMKLKDY